MQYVNLIARVTLGLVLLTFGMDYFVSFLPEPSSTPQGTAFLTALLATGYLFLLVKIVEIFCGILLLSGRFVPLALLLLAPIALNIGLYHALLDRNGAVFGFTAVALELYLAFVYRAHWKSIFAPAPFSRTVMPSLHQVNLSQTDAA